MIVSYCNRVQKILHPIFFKKFTASQFFLLSEIAKVSHRLSTQVQLYFFGLQFWLNRFGPFSVFEAFLVHHSFSFKNALGQSS